jgi:UPF0716 protein FxsA
MLGCLGFLLFLGWMTVETWFAFWQVAPMIGVHTRNSGILEVILLQVAMIGLGIWVFRRNLREMPTAMLAAFTGKGGGEAGRRMVALVGGVLLMIPGFLTDIPGLLFLLPPVQWLFANAAAKVAMILAKQAMKRVMGGGAFPGAAGGFPGAGAGFPGGFPQGGFPFPAKPDDRMQAGGFAKRPKVYDTTAERADGPTKID